MIRNALKVAIRKLINQRHFSLINILGLCAGMATALAIFYYVAFELSYEDFNPLADREYRLVLKRTAGGEEQELPNVPAPIKENLLTYDEIEGVTRFYNVDYQNSAFISEEDGIIRTFSAQGVYYADPDFIRHTGLPVASGNAESFNQHKSVALSHEMAQKLFPGIDPIGKTVKITNNVVSYETVVRLVLDDLPANTDFPFQVLISMQTLPSIEGNQLLEDENFWNFKTYVSLREGTDVEQLTSDIVEALFSNTTEVQWQGELVPVREMHFRPYAMSPAGDRDNLVIISIIGVFIMLLAWINYINLSTTRTLERAREVGVRKVLGAGGNHLRLQFFTEALILNVLAALLAFTIVQAARPFLEGLGNAMIISESQMPVFIGACVLVILTGSILSAWYPSYMISKYKSVDVMAGSFRSSNSGILLRRVLVVFQFAISVLLIIGTYVIHDQVLFMKTMELGMNIDDLIVLQAPPGKINDAEFQNKAESFREALLNRAVISQVSATSSVPGDPINWADSKISAPGETSDLIEMKYLIAMDGEYFETLGIDLVAGRMYNENDNTFSRGDIIINERSAELFGFEFPEDAIGATLNGGNIFPDLRVIGVVENSHHLSGKNAFEPTLYVLSIWANHYLVKLNSDNLDPEEKLETVRSSINEIEELWSTHFPEAPFNYSFLDERFDNQFKSDEKFNQLISLFSVIAVFIAVLGLFGLSSFDVFQRSKEIGIRKVLGASTSGLIIKLTQYYLQLVLISGLVAIPIALWGATQWKQDFAFRSQLSPFLFIVPILAVLVLAAGIVIYQVLQVVRKNPVETLKYE